MPISRDDVIHIANLARIDLTGAEQDKFQRELSSILEFMEKLNEVDTAGVMPMTGGTMRENAVRGDAQSHAELEGKSSGLLAGVSERKEGWVKVKAVFE